MHDVNKLWITFVTLGTGCPPVPRRFSLPTKGHEKECVTHTTMGMVSLPSTRVKYSSSTIHSPYYLYYTHFFSTSLMGDWGHSRKDKLR